MPFPLGRPFGAPHEPQFQRRVLLSVLALLERSSGPVLDDFPDDAPGMEPTDEPWACPLPLPSPPEPANESEAYLVQLLAEVGRLKPWHALATEKHGRTAFGVSGLEPARIDDLAGLVGAAAFDTIAEAPPGAKLPMPQLLRFAADDLKAFYMEAAAAQPAAHPPTPDDINRWLFGSTLLGDALYRARDALAAHEEERALQVASRFMVSAAYSRRPG